MAQPTDGSRTLTRLRVLSGQHAGVSLDWVRPRLQVGPSEELDVYISDWNIQQIELHCDAAGHHQACWPASDDDAPVPGEQRDGATVRCTLQPWVPVRFGAVILCIGPVADPWPDDAQLLQQCFAPPAPDPVHEPVATVVAARPGLRRSPYGRAVMTAAAVGFVVVAASAAMRRGDPSEALEALRVDAPASAAGVAVASAVHGTAASQVTSLVSVPEAIAPIDPVQRLREAWPTDAQDGLSSLELAAHGHRVSVRGVLPSRAAVDQLNNLIDRLPPDIVVSRRYVAVPEVIDRLQEAMPVGGLQIRQTRDSHFEVVGTVDDPARVREVVRRLGTDLAEYGLTIDSALQPRRSGVAAMNGMLIDQDGTSYIRTRDGVKHILSSAAAAAASRQPPAAPRAPAESRHEAR